MSNSLKPKEAREYCLEDVSNWINLAKKYSNPEGEYFKEGELTKALKKAISSFGRYKMVGGKRDWEWFKENAIKPVKKGRRKKKRRK